MLESFNTHLLTNTPKGVIRTRKLKTGKQEMAKRKRNEDNSRYYITQNTEDEAKRWYTSESIPAYGMTPAQIVEQLGRDVLEDWIEAKNLGSFK